MSGLDPRAQKEKAEEFLRSQLVAEQTKTARLEADMNALRSEFAKCDNETEIVATTKKHLGEKVVDALTTLIYLLDNGTDAMKFSAAKYIIDRRLSLEKVGEDNPETAKLNKLLEELGASK